MNKRICGIEKAWPRYLVISDQITGFFCKNRPLLRQSHILRQLLHSQLYFCLFLIFFKEPPYYYSYFSHADFDKCPILRQLLYSSFIACFFIFLCFRCANHHSTTAPLLLLNLSKLSCRIHLLRSNYYC